jgi:hypothetical protein
MTSQPMTSQATGTARDPRRDFDFLHGSWRIDDRRLSERLVGCQDWEEFSTEMRCYPILGGAGNLDEGAFPSRGYHAMSLRLYDGRPRPVRVGRPRAPPPAASGSAPRAALRPGA